MKDLVNDFFDSDEKKESKDSEGKIKKAVTDNPVASDKRKNKTHESSVNQENGLPKSIRYIDNEINLATRKTSYINASNHDRIKLLSELYNIPMSKIENNIINYFFEKHRDLLNDELKKKQNGF